MEAAAIAIRRFSSVYRCAPRGDAGQRVRERLDGVARRAIAAQVEALAAALGRGDDRSVWVIRRLSFSCVVNGAWDDDRIAQAWARRLVYALALELAAGGSDDVIRFASPAEQLARFIVDLAGGDAYGKWYNAGFAGLRALPASMAIRTALAEAGADGAEALRLLSATQLHTLLHTLAPADALAVLHRFAAIADATAPPGFAPLAEAMLQTRPPHPVEDARWGLAAFVAAAWRYPGNVRSLVEAVAATALYTLERRADADGRPATAPARTGWPETLGAREILERLPAAARACMPDLASAAAPPGHTAFGGAFLLLPVLASMPFDAWVRGWPPVGRIAPECLVRALVLGTCLGPDLLGDPLWRDLLGLPGDIDWPAAGSALGALRPGALGGLCKGLRAHARDHGALPQLHKTVRAAGEDWRIDYDADGYWHRIAVARPGRHRLAADADVHHLVSRLPLSLPLPLPPAWGRLLCLAAQQVLRRFARRLPGFALSHLDYLQANFLCLPATVEMRGTQVLAGLGRPPLALMLDLAGMTRTTFDLPWHAGRTCVLHAERA